MQRSTLQRALLSASDAATTTSRAKVRPFGPYFRPRTPQRRRVAPKYALSRPTFGLGRRNDDGSRQSTPFRALLSASDAATTTDRTKVRPFGPYFRPRTPPGWWTAPKYALSRPTFGLGHRNNDGSHQSTPFRALLSASDTATTTGRTKVRPFAPYFRPRTPQRRRVAPKYALSRPTFGLGRRNGDGSRQSTPFRALLSASNAATATDLIKVRPFAPYFRPRTPQRLRAQRPRNAQKKRAATATRLFLAGCSRLLPVSCYSDWLQSCTMFPSRNFSQSSAAMHPLPAAVIAWRYF